MSDTPRTDALEATFGPVLLRKCIELALEHARQLEREVAALRDTPRMRLQTFVEWLKAQGVSMDNPIVTLLRDAWFAAAAAYNQPALSEAVSAERDQTKAEEK